MQLTEALDVLSTLATDANDMSSAGLTLTLDPERGADVATAARYIVDALRLASQLQNLNPDGKVKWVLPPIDTTQRC